MAAADLLRRVSLFVDMRDVELAALGDCLGNRDFAKDIVLFNKRSRTQSLYLVEFSSEHVFALFQTGQEIALSMCGPSVCFGETTLLENTLCTYLNGLTLCRLLHRPLVGQAHLAGIRIYCEVAGSLLS